ncbi:MAG: hypothetical protein WC858_01075 [Parcubacteria group bacterium]|jgi:rRNA-processing protein FCF1
MRTTKTGRTLYKILEKMAERRDCLRRPGDERRDEAVEAALLTWQCCVITDGVPAHEAVRAAAKVMGLSLRFYAPPFEDHAAAKHTGLSRL